MILGSSFLNSLQKTFSLQGLSLADETNTLLNSGDGHLTPPHPHPTKKKSTPFKPSVGLLSSGSQEETEREGGERGKREKSKEKTMGFIETREL